MNSYINPAHEQAAAEKLKEWLPDTYMTFSTDLTREWYEYERCSTVAANAYVGPQVSSTFANSMMICRVKDSTARSS